MGTIVKRSVNFLVHHTICCYKLSSLQRCMSTLKCLPYNASSFGNKVAIKDENGNHNYNELFSLSCNLKDILKRDFQFSSGERIAFLTPNNAIYTICQWSVWLNGGIGVPLSPKYPLSELKYLVENSRSSLVISTSQYHDIVSSIAQNLNIPHLSLPENLSAKCVESQLYNVDESLVNDSGLIIYTSGTTGRPKGVVHTQSSLNAQVQVIKEEYEVCESDVALHVLPLHHVHGIVNMLMCPLSCGATVVMEKEFDPERVWNHLLQKTEPKINLFMAVPTIYVKLIEYFEKNKMSVEETVEQCKNIRLMVSGSSALPVSVLRKWKEITGHVLLERYGMTEIGMGLTNQYKGERVPGAVGLPFPNVKVQIVSTKDDGTPDMKNPLVVADKNCVEEFSGREGEHGELLIKTPCMFDRYFDNPKATEDSFIEGWFRTGDTAAYKNGVFRIVGRTSVDIIKSGGYKISALDLEEKLMNYPAISEISVVGVPNSLWGEQVAAVISLKEGADATTLSIQDWCRQYMPSYHVPKLIKLVDKIPRNVMGKVNKKQLVRNYFELER